MKNKKILELCLAHGLGGLEMFVASCHGAFSKQTTCKVVVAPHSKLDDYLENVDKFHLKRNKFFPIIPALKLAKYIDDEDIDILHFHWTKDMITAVLAKLLSKKKPKLIQSRHMGMTRFKDDFYHRWLYKNIDMMHAVTKLVQSQLKKFIPQDVCPTLTTVYLGTTIPEVSLSKVEQLRKNYALNKSEFVVGIVGRIEEGKGQYKVLEALKILNDLEIRAVIVGSFMDKGYEKELRALIEDLGIGSKVILTGFTKEVYEHMKLFDVNILATKNETFGLVVIEAMANKVPVIATNKGGPLEIIKDGFDGLLFDGSSEDLAEKIRYLYKNAEKKEYFAENGFNTVQKRFDAKKQLKKLYEAMP